MDERVLPDNKPTVLSNPALPEVARHSRPAGRAPGDNLEQVLMKLAGNFSALVLWFYCFIQKQVAWEDYGLS